MAGGKRKFTNEEKGQIFHRLREGASVSEVARELQTDPRRIGGLLSTWRNNGILPASVGDGNEWHPAPTTSFSPMAPPTPPPVESSSPTIPWYTSATARYDIERTVPADGYLGVFRGWLDWHKFNWRYGSGIYRIRISEGGFPIETFTWVVDDWYESPKFPPPYPDWEPGDQQPPAEEWL